MNKKYIWIACCVAAVLLALLLIRGCHRGPSVDAPETSLMPGYLDDSTVAPTTLPQSTVPTDPAVPTDPSVPEQTTVPVESTEPEETTRPTQPRPTQPRPTEPPATTGPTEPPVTTEPTEPPVTTEPTEPPVTTEPTEPPVTTEPTEPPATTEPTEPPVTTLPEETIPETTAPIVTEPVDASGRLKFTTYGRFTGKFVEDGRDEFVRNVAILLVSNVSDEYLQFAVLTFDISGKPAAFTVTGLNPGESAWVLEQNRLAIGTDAVFTHMDDLVSFAPDNRDKTKDVQVHLGDGQLSVTNNTGKDLSGVYIYYKQRHTDGNFLGGITYRVPMGDLSDGNSASAIAAHCDPATCEVVRIEWEKEA